MPQIPVLEAVLAGEASPAKHAPLNYNLSLVWTTRVYLVPMIIACIKDMMSKLNKNAWRIYAVTTSALIKLPGLNNQEIGGSFVNLIDEAFKNYALFQQT